MYARLSRTRLFRISAALGCAVLLAALAPAARAASQASAALPPVAPTAVPGVTPPDANGAICYYGACYNYVDALQFVDAAGASVIMSQARPELDTSDPDAHSLQEIAVESTDGLQIVEVGWTVDEGLNGDTLPHLFIYHWVNGQESCYNGCGFVSTLRAIQPGQRLNPHSIGEFGIVNRGGNWWILYDGLPLGYYPGSLWGGTFTRFGLVQAFGEVASTAVPSCSDMGNGRFGSDVGSSWIAGFHLVDGASAAQFTPGVVTTPDEYDSGSMTTTSYHLGGPGDGSCG